MRVKKILVWFRNDLRLHDNEMLVEAVAKSDGILPVYFFDPRYFGSTALRADKIGIVRARFLSESVLALRDALIAKGGNLLIVHGKPEDHMGALVEQYDIAEVYHHREVSFEETAISAQVEDILWKQKINLKHFIGHTLYNKEDLPFPIKDIPDVFNHFKKKAERDATVKPCLPEPEKIVFVESEDWGSMPDPVQLGISENSVSLNSTLAGGELAGLHWLDGLLREDSGIYHRQPKQIPGKQAFTSNLSPWLTSGCLSPRMVYWAIKKAEQEYGTNPNFNQILLGLLWRDYYRFMLKKHGVRFFNSGDVERVVAEVKPQESLDFENWKGGRTGHHLVDEYMCQLNESGFISHAGRLVVATYLIYALKEDWKKGAAYFEERLIDYSASSNWGNWATIAGSGLELKNKSVFDLEKQLRILNIDVAGVA